VFSDRESLEYLFGHKRMKHEIKKMNRILMNFDIPINVPSMESKCSCK